MTIYTPDNRKAKYTNMTMYTPYKKKRKSSLISAAQCPAHAPLFPPLAGSSSPPPVHPQLAFVQLLCPHGLVKTPSQGQQ